jgi:sugar phosphate isomerase/epimerase
MPSFSPTIAGSTLPLMPADGQDPDELPGQWLAGLRKLRGSGFTSVDIVDSWVAFGRLDSAGLAAFQEAVAQSGLSVVGLSSIRRSVIDPDDAEQNLIYTHRAIEVAAALGAPVLSIGFHRPLTPDQQGWPFWSAPSPKDSPGAFGDAVARLTDLAAHGRDVGVQLSLELYEYTLVGSGAQAARLVEAVGVANLGINADLANLYRIPERLTESWAETLRLCLPYMNYWHVKNYQRAEVFPAGPFLAWPTRLDDGDINYRAALRAAADADYSGPICIEHYGGDGLTAQAAGLVYLTSLLEDL